VINLIRDDYINMVNQPFLGQRFSRSRFQIPLKLKRFVFIGKTPHQINLTGKSSLVAET
jgi:hypothetical protein